jgi:hypothetical protein
MAMAVIWFSIEHLRNDWARMEAAMSTATKPEGRGQVYYTKIYFVCL